MIRLKPKSTIIITGAPCLGKSTVTRELLNNIEGDYLVGETDVIRQILRNEREQLYQQIIQGEEQPQLRADLGIDILQQGLSTMNFDQVEKQSDEVIGAVYNLIQFSHSKNRSFIGEGVNLTLSSLLGIKNIEKLVSGGQFVFFNLGMLNEDSYKKRYESRYGEINHDNNKFNTYFNMNINMMCQVNDAASKYNNVFNINVENMSIDDTISKMCHIIQTMWM